MAYSYVRYSGNGSTTNYTFSFPTISTDHIKVRVNGTLVTNWSFLNSSTIQFAAAPASGTVIEIRRETPKDSTIVNFTDGSVLLERDLDLLATWQLYLGQETEDDIEDTIRVDSQSRFDAQNRRIINVADPINAQDAVTKVYADAVIGQATAAASAAAAVQVALAADEAVDSAASALAAAASASSAGTSATNAASSASAAAASYDSFDDRYLGAKAVAPTIDNDGQALLVGATFWDTVSSQMFVWAGSQWKPTFLTGNAVRSLIVATAGQTVVTVPTYVVAANTLQVFVNGVKVLVGSDYTETNQNTITFASGLTAGDEVEAIALQPYAIGTTGAESVSFQQSGATVVRTVDAKLKEEVSALDFGVKNDGTTTQTEMDALMASSHKVIRFPAGVYRAGLNNGTSNRTFIFDEGAIIDGVAHIATGTGPDYGGGSIVWVDNVRVIGTLTATVRVGTYYCRKLNIDKIRITEISSTYAGQTAAGGSTGVHLYFGTHDTYIGEIICDSAALFYGLGVDRSTTNDADHTPTNIHIGRLIVKNPSVPGLVTANTLNLRIDEVDIRGQGAGNVGVSMSADTNLYVGRLRHNGTGASSGQTGIYIQSGVSASFGEVEVFSVPGIGFRTFNTGTVKIDTLRTYNNREGARFQSRATVGEIDATNNSEIGVYFNTGANFSYVEKITAIGTAGIGVQVDANDVTVQEIVTGGMTTGFGLYIASGVRFRNSYINAYSNQQGIRCLSAGPVDMGVMYITNNTFGFVGSGMSAFSYHFARYSGNTSYDSNVVFEALAGFSGKMLRASVGANRGDASVTVAVGTDAVTQRFETPLTTTRTVTLSTTGAVNGDKFRVVRTASATGASALNVSSFAGIGTKVLAVGQWLDAEFNGGNWSLTAFGSL